MRHILFLAILSPILLFSNSSAQYFVGAEIKRDTLSLMQLRTVGDSSERSVWPLTVPLSASQFGVPVEMDPFWQTAEVDVYSTGMIWRDCNNDGYVDVFFSNGNDIVLAQNFIYLSDYGSLPSSASWYSANAEYSGHCAVGDIDDNGFPDFAVSNYLGAGGFDSANLSNMYLNPSGLPNPYPNWYTADSIYSFSCALGDADGDGDLDLAVATGEGYTKVLTPDVIYYNIDGTLQTTPGWQSALMTAAVDVTWGDVDNDGDLDLAFCCDSIGAAVYCNNAGVMETTPTWRSSHQEPANTLIFGDANNDGWLDLIVAYNDQLGGTGYYRLYYNDGAGNLDPDAGWRSLSGGYGSALALYDYDNDGDDDLAAGRWFDRLRIYENLGGTFTTTPVWRANTEIVAEELAWVDIDGDGVEMRADTFYVAGDRKLFYVRHSPLYSIDSVLVDGLVLGYSGYCYDLVSGWVSLGQAPSDSAIIYYQYSFNNDLTVANWDTCNMAFENTNRPRIDVYADVTFGWAPLIVQFSDSSLDATEWLWRFGDGDSSLAQHPLHIYDDGGAYDIYAEFLLPDGWHNRTIRRMVIALADTVVGEDVFGAPGGSVELTVYVRNSFPVRQMKLPVEYGGPVSLVFDSFSTAGCRAEYFEVQTFSHYDVWNRRLTIKLQSSTDGSQPELSPGAGSILKLYFTILSSAQPSQTTAVELDGYDSYEPMFFGSELDYQPWMVSGSVTTVPCCVGIRGNINGDGADQIDISDLLYFVEYSFGSPPGPAPPCFEEADVDASGVIDIGGVLYMVEYMFGVPPGPAPVDCP